MTQKEKGTTTIAEVNVSGNEAEGYVFEHEGSENIPLMEETTSSAPFEEGNTDESVFKGRNMEQHPTRDETTISFNGGPEIPFDKAMKNLERASERLEMFPIPEKKEFEGKQFLASEDLKVVAGTLIEKYSNDFRHLKIANVIYLWKETGGETGGMATLGKCVRPSGLAAYFAAPDAGANVDYIIWCAADHMRDNKANYRTICALLFHELCHTRLEDGKFLVMGHEFEGYAREIEEFGLWQHSIKRIAEACETVKDVQQGLFTNHSD